MEQYYLSTIDENAHSLAKRYGLGLEIAEFCTPWYLDTHFSEVDPIIREKMSCTDRHILHGPFSELFPCAIDPKIREVALERYRQVIAVAKHYGIFKIVLHGGYNPRIYYPVWYTEQSVLFWKDFVKEIPEGMVICLENVFEEESAMLTEIIRQVNSPKLRMCLDVGHVNAYSRVSVFDWLESAADLISHFHIHNNDSFQDTHSPIMEGTIPMKKLLDKIKILCPDASITLELTDAESSVRYLMEA